MNIIQGGSVGLHRYQVFNDLQLDVECRNMEGCFSILGQHEGSEGGERNNKYSGKAGAVRVKLWSIAADLILLRH